MKECRRCKIIFGADGKVCPLCELKLLDYNPNLILPSKEDITYSVDENKSLKANIPEGVKSFLDLKAGDKLEWKMDTDGKSPVCIVTRKTVNDRRTD